MGEAVFRKRPFKLLVESRMDTRSYGTAARRSICKYEKDRWVKLVDQALGVDRYWRVNQRVQQIGAYLACTSILVQNEHFV